MQAAIVFLVNLIDVYSWVLVIRILLSWLPNIRWYNQPWKTLDQLTEPALAPFRRLIPALGGIDFSPILLFMLLKFLSGLLLSLAF